MRDSPDDSFSDLLSDWEEDAPWPDDTTLLSQDKAGLPSLDNTAGVRLERDFTIAKDMIKVAWSPDGTQLTIGSEDKFIRIWDLRAHYPKSRLKGHKHWVYSVPWSPDGTLIASCSWDGTVRLWDVLTRHEIAQWRSPSPSNRIFDVAWSPNGQWLAWGGDDKLVHLCTRADFGDVAHDTILQGHADRIYSVCWSPHGEYLASSGQDKSVRVWDAGTGAEIMSLWHPAPVCCAIWSQDGQLLLSGGDDGAIHVWDAGSGRELRRLEAHTGTITALSLSFDGVLLASKSYGLSASTIVWRTDRWEPVGMSEVEQEHAGFGVLAFHPTQHTLVGGGPQEGSARIWHFDLNYLLRNDPIVPMVQYRNAKVVLVGDASVGKTALAAALNGEPYSATSSTHGRRVWTLSEETVAIAPHQEEQREILLWDLAGQPGYRLIHQLHLDEVAVALVVFDGRNETNPLAGIQHWDRALKQAMRVGSSPMSARFLVEARIDRGGVGMSEARKSVLLGELGYDDWVATSSLEGTNIKYLRDRVCESIDWDALPKVTTTVLFARIKVFLVAEKAAGHVLRTINDLHTTYAESLSIGEVVTRAQFETCIALLASRGLIQRLSFGELVLLQPELLDAYASALVNAVRDEPEGLGSILEESVKRAEFRVPADEKLADRGQEQLLLIAMIEDMVRRELAIREETNNGTFLVFPAQSTRVNPDLPEPPGRSIIIEFEGPITSIYATLAVRLSQSGLFIKKELWKDAITYNSNVQTNTGAMYGLSLRILSEARGELTLFFTRETTEETRSYFEGFVVAHVKRWALPESIRYRRIVCCPACDEEIPPRIVQHRRERGYRTLKCPVCEMTVELDREEQRVQPYETIVEELDKIIERRRNRQANALTLEGKLAMQQYDVFLCHNHLDKPAVKAISDQLRAVGILPWLDEEQLQPGTPWVSELEKQIKNIHAAAIFIGQKGIGPWQDMEIEALLRQFVKRKCPVIPVILPECQDQVELPVFLAGMTWVYYHKDDPDSLQRLKWGITGIPPEPLARLPRDGGVLTAQNGNRSDELE